jgi:hypothetical protein
MPSSDALSVTPKSISSMRKNAEVGLATRPDQHALRGDRLRLLARNNVLGHQMHDAF